MFSNRIVRWSPPMKNARSPQDTRTNRSDVESHRNRSGFEHATPTALGLISFSLSYIYSTPTAFSSAVGGKVVIPCLGGDPDHRHSEG